MPDTLSAPFLTAVSTVFGAQLKPPFGGNRLYVLALTFPCPDAVAMRREMRALLRAGYGRSARIAATMPLHTLEDGRPYIELVNDQPVDFCDASGKQIYNIALPTGSLVRARGVYRLASAWHGIIPIVEEVQIIATVCPERVSRFPAFVTEPVAALGTRSPP